MRRRDFIKAIAGSATSWPLAARAAGRAPPCNRRPASDFKRVALAFVGLRSDKKALDVIREQNDKPSDKPAAVHPGGSRHSRFSEGSHFHLIA
jgi:hypothetical protein